MPVHHHARRPAPRAERGLTNYWGYNTLGVLRAGRAATRRRVAAGRGARVQDDGAGAARRRHRGHPRRRLQPHRRRQSARADAVAARHRQRVVLPAAADDPRYYMDFTGCGNTLNMRSPRVLQLIMDSLRYWVLGDARRRLPLRPRERAGSRAARRRPARRVLRHHPSGPGAVAGEADRRAVGPRRRRLPGRQLPGAWTEWNGKYRDAVRRFWRGDGGARVGAGDAAVRQQRPLRAERPPAVREHQLHHRARRLHARRSRQLQREAQRGERRGQPRRREQQPQLELRRRGADRRPPRPRAARAAAAQLHGDAAALARRADDQRRRRARAARSTATTTPTARTTSSAGRPGSSRRSGGTSSSSPAG